MKKVTTELFMIDGKLLCVHCAEDAGCKAEPVCQSARLPAVGRLGRPNRNTARVGLEADCFACELCGAELRVMCPYCGEFHLNPALDLERQALKCSIESSIARFQYAMAVL